MRLTEAQIAAGRSEKGGWTRATLKSWGVPWPPPAGWRKRLTQRAESNLSPQRKTVFRAKTCADDFPLLPFARYYFRKPFSRQRSSTP